MQMPQSKQFLLLFSLIVLSVLILFATYRLTKDDEIMPPASPSNSVDEAEIEVAQRDTITVYLQPPSDESTGDYTLGIDSAGRQLKTVALLLKPANTNSLQTMNFTISPTLRAAGWQAVLSQVSADGMAYEIALLSTRADGAQVLNQADSLGTLTSRTESTFELDSAVSVATTNLDEILNLELVSGP